VLLGEAQVGIADSPDPQASRWKISGIFVEVFFTW